jgi:acetoin utilization protein AcuB
MQRVSPVPPALQDVQGTEMSDTLPNAMVCDWMTPFVITVDPYSSLAKAYELMRKNHIRRLPVVRKGKLLGIVTLSDILGVTPGDLKHLRDFDQAKELMADYTVAVAMTNDLVSVYRTDTVGHAADLMYERKIGGLPVCDSDGKLVGVITSSDVFRNIAKAWREDNKTRFAGV